MKRSIRPVTTSESIREQAGSGTEPSSSTASWNAPSRAAPTRVHALHSQLRRSPRMYRKRLMIDSRITWIHEARGVRIHRTPSASIQIHSAQISCIVSGLRWIRFRYLSFNSLLSRGGHGFPAFTAARLASRIATICFACARVSSRRLASPPRLPMAARYSPTFFCASFISMVANHAS